MRLLAVADLHLGFIQGTKLTKAGINQRSADVAQSFSRFIDRAIELQPDVITIAGDLFHFPKPSNHALQHAMREFGRLTRALPETIVIAVAGNHDLGKSDDVGCALPLLEHVGVTVVTTDAMRLQYPTGLSVLCVPDVAGKHRPELTADPNARWNVLVIHGEIAGVKQGNADQRANLRDVTPEELGADGWTAVCCGHYHQHEAIAPNAFYSGSLDYVSSNIWQELATPKGFVEVELETCVTTFHELTPTRRIYDLPAINAAEMTAPELDAAIAERMASVEIDGAVVRLVVEHVTRDTERGLDQRALRSYHRRALYLRFDPRRVDPMTRIRSVTTARKAQLESLATRTERRLRTVDLPADVDREDFAALGMSYFDRTLESERDSLIPSERETALERQLTESIDSTTQTPLKRTA